MKIIKYAILTIGNIASLVMLAFWIGPFNTGM